MTKNIFSSRTFWFNALTTAVAILGLINEQPWITPQVSSFLLMAVGIINVFLRMITTKPVTFLLAAIACSLALSGPQLIAQDVDAAPQKPPAVKTSADTDSDKLPTASVVEVVEANGDRFHNAVIRAAIEANRKGELKRVDVIRLRVAMLSPAFRAQAKQLALIQMASSGSDSTPLGTDGKIDEAKVNWEDVLSFLEKLLPFLLQLINALS